jgi:type I restriction enzyme R subunit
MDQWDQKDQTKARVRTTITDLLFEKLPYPEYEESDIEVKTELIFEYFKGEYGMVA